MAWPLFITLGIGAASALLLAGNFAFYDVLEDVNSRSPIDQQIGPMWVNTKLFMVLQRHRKLFPHSALRTRMWSFMIAGFSLFLLTVALGLSHYSAVGR
jgi:hypothetical protein